MDSEMRIPDWEGVHGFQRIRESYALYASQTDPENRWLMGRIFLTLRQRMWRVWKGCPCGETRSSK